MGENQWLADRFEEHRPHLRAAAFRMPARSPRPTTPSRTPGCASAGLGPAKSRISVGG
jgi:hypothetical protein